MSTPETHSDRLVRLAVERRDTIEHIAATYGAPEPYHAEELRWARIVIDADGYADALAGPARHWVDDLVSVEDENIRSYR